MRRSPLTRVERVALGALLLTTAVLYLWNLSASGWANGFYSAAAQAGASDWTAMLFGSSDAGNAITVDKTPGALWVMDVSVRLFGLSSWSVLVPQALEGVAAVGLLYAAVRRAAGPSAALLAGAVFALTPVAALMFRFNNPDALLVLALVAGAYCVQRACERDSSRWWLAAAGAAVGIGFLAKMLQAFLVLPAFGLAYLVAAAVPLRMRLVRLAGAFAAMVVSGGWYLLLVELWPASSRPYVGGSQNDSILELALGYNGLGRLTGDETGGLGNMNFDVGWGRLFGNSMGAYIAWLIPAAVVCIAAGLLITRRAPRTDPTRAGLILWGTWLVVTAIVFSYANGILHQYYTVALAPAIGAGIGIGAILLWRNRFDVRAAIAMSGTVLVTVSLAAVLLARRYDWLPWLGAAVAVAGVGAAVLLLVVSRLPGRVAAGVAALAIAACLAAPTAYAVATAATPHSGAIPSVGPPRAHGSFGGPGGPGGGFLDIPEAGPTLTALLADGADGFQWTAAVVGSSNAAGYQLAGGAPVMAVGGFNGTDPAPTLAEFKQDVADGRIHYFIHGRSMMFGMPGGRESSGSREAADISAWVTAHYSEKKVDGVEIYDLTEPPKS
ncbi:glycosyltransferase family 39 protein [Mycolicibacterium sp.]|uniref:ArnT family glycosyltransferase n=1 Tax=Mycolicibacterium sp. TaxID=2320850 RepID=UPI002600D8BE|nr:glycosyltransferase family 39 protein [Mycolicibacterium sp.]